MTGDGRAGRTGWTTGWPPKIAGRPRLRLGCAGRGREARAPGRPTARDRAPRSRSPGAGTRPRGRSRTRRRRPAPSPRRGPPVPSVPASPSPIRRRSVRRARALAAPPAGRSLRRPRDRMPDRLRGPGRLVARLDVASLHGCGPARPGPVLGLLGHLTLGREPVPLREAVGTAFALPHRVRTLTDFHLEFVVHLDQPLYLP